MIKVIKAICLLSILLLLTGCGNAEGKKMYNKLNKLFAEGNFSEGLGYIENSSDITRGNYTDITENTLKFEIIEDKVKITVMNTRMEARNSGRYEPVKISSYLRNRANSMEYEVVEVMIDYDKEAESVTLPDTIINQLIY